MVTITLPSELERVVAAEAARRGTTAEGWSLHVLQERFLAPANPEKAASRAAASMQPVDLSEAEAAALREVLASGAARPKIKIAPLPEYRS